MKSNASAKHHGDKGPQTDHPPVPEPSHAERARTLVHLGKIGSLSTLSRKHPEWPFGSVMPYGLDEGGSPIFLISTMAMHTQNILRDPRASLLVSRPETDEDPLGASRVTVMGKVSRVPEEDLEGIKERYLARHENARYWVDFGDFAFYRLEVADVYFVGGFGIMGWVTAEEYYKAEVDPLTDIAPEIIGHMNEDHADALVLLAQYLTGDTPEGAKMTAVDRLGFHLRLKTGDGMHSTRIAFTREVRNATEVRAVLVEMVRNAREKG